MEMQSNVFSVVFGESQVQLKWTNNVFSAGFFRAPTLSSGHPVKGFLVVFLFFCSRPVKGVQIPPNGFWHLETGEENRLLKTSHR